MMMIAVRSAKNLTLYAKLIPPSERCETNKQTCAIFFTNIPSYQIALPTRIEKRLASEHAAPMPQKAASAVGCGICGYVKKYAIGYFLTVFVA